MLNCDLAISAEWLYTGAEGSSLLKNHAIIIDQGKILDILPFDHIAKKYQPKSQKVYQNKILIPGLINCHTHLPMSLFRGLADDLTLQDWLQNHMFPAEKQFVDSHFVKVGTALSCAELIAGGVTTVCDMYFHSHDVASTLENIGMRGVVGCALQNFAMPGVTGWDDSLQQGLDFVSQWKRHKLISPALAPHAPYSVTKKQFAEARKASNEQSVPLVMHVLETQKEAKELKKSWGTDPVVQMAKQELLEGKTIFAHMVHPTKKDLKALKKFEVGIAHCPHSNLKLADGIAPLHQMIEMDIAVGVGTDSCASNNRLDIWSELKTTALVQKTIQNDPTILSARETLGLTHGRAARALGLEKQIGQLKKNLRADFAVINLETLHTFPTYDVISHLIYCATPANVEATYVDGQCLYENGNFLTLDLENLKSDAQLIAKKIAHSKAK